MYSVKIAPFLDASAAQYLETSASNAEDKAQLLKFYRDNSAEVFLAVLQYVFVFTQLLSGCLLPEQC